MKHSITKVMVFALIVVSTYSCTTYRKYYLNTMHELREEGGKPKLNSNYNVQFDTIYDYSKVVDYDGVKTRIVKWEGKWEVKDSTLVDHYGDNKSLTKEWFKKTYYWGSPVYHVINDFQDTVEYQFQSNGKVVVVNESFPNEYMIYTP